MRNDVLARWPGYLKPGQGQVITSLVKLMSTEFGTKFTESIKKCSLWHKSLDLGHQNQWLICNQIIAMQTNNELTETVMTELQILAVTANGVGGGRDGFIPDR